MPYPDGYRDWRHVKSMVIQPGHPLHESFGGIHHLYANKKALEGYKTGKFPDGSVIVFDLLEAPAADSAITEGARKVAGVMHKDAKKYAATGGWGYEGFGGGDRSKRVVGAALLTREPVTFTNVPHLNDIGTMLKLLEQMGVKVSLERGKVGRHPALTPTPHGQAPLPSAPTMMSDRALLTGPDRTTARSNPAKATAATVPTAYSAVVMPASPRSRTRRASRLILRTSCVAIATSSASTSACLAPPGEHSSRLGPYALIAPTTLWTTAPSVPACGQPPPAPSAMAAPLSHGRR